MNIPPWLVPGSPDWKWQLAHMQRQGMTRWEAIKDLERRRAIFNGRATLEQSNEEPREGSAA